MREFAETAKSSDTSPDGFYSLTRKIDGTTSLSLIVNLAPAVAVEYRLLRPRILEANCPRCKLHWIARLKGREERVTLYCEACQLDFNCELRGARADYEKTLSPGARLRFRRALRLRVHVRYAKPVRQNKK